MRLTGNFGLLRRWSPPACVPARHFYLLSQSGGCCSTWPVQFNHAKRHLNNTHNNGEPP